MCRLKERFSLRLKHFFLENFRKTLNHKSSSSFWLSDSKLQSIIGSELQYCCVEKGEDVSFGVKRVQSSLKGRAFSICYCSG